MMGRDCVATIRDYIFSVRLLWGALFKFPIKELVNFAKFTESKMIKFEVV